MAKHSLLSWEVEALVPKPEERTRALEALEATMEEDGRDGSTPWVIPAQSGFLRGWSAKEASLAQTTEDSAQMTIEQFFDDPQSQEDIEMGVDFLIPEEEDEFYNSIETFFLEFEGKLHTRKEWLELWSTPVLGPTRT